MSIVSDDFQTTQADNTSLAVGTWTPPGTRQTVGLNVSISDVNTSVPGSWFFSKANLGSTAGLTYIFTVPQDFLTNVNAILLVGVSFTVGNPNMILQLDDGTNTQAVSAAVIGGTVTWAMSSFGTLDLTTIEEMDILPEGSAAVTGSAQGLISTIVCVATNTQIEISKNVTIPIQNLRRGDYVLGSDNETHRIAKILRSKLHGSYLIDIVKIPKDAITKSQPNNDLLISGWHPILYQGVRKPAKCFANFPGVSHWFHTIQASEIIPMDDNFDGYSMFNLQFDHEVLFKANGLWIQAVSPHSAITPLPRKLFWDTTYIDRPLTNESHITETLWNDDILDI